MNRIVDWLLRIAVGRVPWEPVDPASTIPEYKLPEEWPQQFMGGRPDKWVAHMLLTNAEGFTGGHLFYRNPYTNKIATGVVTANQSHRIKEVMFWLNGGTIDTGQKFQSVSAACGKPHCMAPEHLKVSYVPVPPVYVNVLPKPLPKAGPPVYKPKRRKKSYNPKTDPDRDEATRKLCVSAKYTYDEPTAKRIEREQQARVSGTGAKKLYAYPCEWCGQWHHTSHDPKKRKKHHVTNSSY